MSIPYFFGYGSLVNRRTHGYGDIQPARLAGWRRVWRQTTYAPRPILTVERCDGVSINGLIAHVPNDDWDELDQREHAYDRVSVNGAVAHDLQKPTDIATYTVPLGKHCASDALHAIYLSYLDVVVQGYLAEFGAEGVRSFFDTTVGWEAPIRNDRAAPLYPRHQKLLPDEVQLVDSELARVGSQVLL